MEVKVVKEKKERKMILNEGILAGDSKTNIKSEMLNQLNRLEKTTPDPSDV